MTTSRFPSEPGAPAESSVGRPSRAYDAAMALLVLIVLSVHLAIANLPNNAFIFDEAYYVPAARALLLGIPSNLEYPPLAKLLIALSIKVFGDVTIAWRLPSILFGTLAIPVLYLLTRTLADRKTALIAAFLLSFESLWFIHSSIAMLDIAAVSLALLALLFFVRREWVWAGALLGLSMLAKEMTVLLLVVLPLFTLLQAPNTRSRNAWAHAMKVGSFVAVSALVVFMAGLQIYDSAYNAFPTSFDHVARMFRHNQAIAAPPASDAVRPFQWFSGYAPAGYLLTFADIGNGVKRYYVQYFGQPNLVIVLLAWLAVPFSIPRLGRKDPNATLHLLLLLVPLVFFLGLAQWRVTYPYYILICIPSLCVLCATFLAQFPRAVILTFGLGVVMWFLIWFPRNLLTLGMK